MIRSFIVLLALSVCFLGVNILLAQTLTLSQVLEIHESDDNAREKLLLSYGFTLAESGMKELNGAVIPTDYYTWRNNQEQMPPIETMVVVRTAHPRTGKKMETSYVIYSEPAFLFLKLRAWELGFQFIEEGADNGNIALTCQNSKYWLRFFADTYPNNRVYGVTIEEK